MISNILFDLIFVFSLVYIIKDAVIVLALINLIILFLNKIKVPSYFIESFRDFTRCSMCLGFWVGFIYFYLKYDGDLFIYLSVISSVGAYIFNLVINYIEYKLEK